MRYDTIEYSVSDSILTLTLNRPEKLNAFNGPMMNELLQALDTADADDDVDRAAPVSVALTRQMMWRMLGADHPMEAHKVDSRSIDARGASPDAKEGVMAFLEKRPAQFTAKVSTDMPAFFPWWQPRPYE